MPETTVLIGGNALRAEAHDDGSRTLKVSGGAGSGGGSSDTTEATQILVRTAVEAINTKTPALSGGAVPVAPNVTRGNGAADANTQRVTIASDGPLNTAIGAQADAAAGTDTGSFSILAFIKRGLQNWTTLLARVPTVALSGRMRTEELGTALVARQLAAGASSANTALTTSCRRISIHARGGNIRFAIGSSSQTASGTSHFIAQGERIDLAVPATPNIAVIRADATDCTLEVMELGEPV